MPNFIALGCVEVGEKFRVWVVVVGSFPLQKPHYTNLKLGWVRLWLGWAVTICAPNDNIRHIARVQISYSSNVVRRATFTLLLKVKKVSVVEIT